MSKLSEKTVYALLNNVVQKSVGDRTLTNKTVADSSQHINNMDHVFHKVLDTHYPISIRCQKVIARNGTNDHIMKMRKITERQKQEAWEKKKS